MSSRFRLMMYPPLARVLPYVKEGRISLRNLSAKSGVGESRLRELLSSIPEVAKLSHTTVVFKKGSKLRLAFFLAQSGVPLVAVARDLHWSDFEALACSILAEFGYKVSKGVRVKPRLEIDILAQRYDHALALDCKHWLRPLGLKTLSRFMEMQVKRVAALLKDPMIRTQGTRRVLPTILTLRSENVKLIDGIPVVPVDKLSGFLLDFESYSGELRWLVEKV